MARDGEQTRHIGGRFTEELRQDPGARRDRPERGAGYGPWPAWAQRSGQDHGGTHSDDAPRAGRGAGRGRWPRRRAAGGRVALAHRAHGPVRRRGRVPHGPREPGDGRTALPPAEEAGPQEGRRAPGAFRPRGRRLAAGQDVLWRHAPPARPGGEPRLLAARPLPRRADNGARPQKPHRHVGHYRRAGLRRDDAAPDDAVPG